ncbi:unnamed protein product, partial [Staurois parvus]
MALGRKGLTSGVIKEVNCVLFYCVLCVLYTVNTVLCRAIQRSVQELTGERSVLFLHRSLPH